MLRNILILSCVFVAGLGADVITLKSGRTLRGQYLGGDARQVRLAVDDRIETLQVDEIATIQFIGPSVGVSAPPPAPEPRVLRPGRTYEPPPPPPSAAPAFAELPSGTPIVIRMTDGVDSQRDRLGQTFRASVTEPVVVDGQTVIPRGADAVAKLVSDEQSGKFEGKTVLTLDLQQVQVNGRMVDINTSDVSRSSGSRGARTAKVVGGTTVLGAIIGGVVGGGVGAAAGAASGAAVGGAAQVLTKGQRVRIPAETVLTFTLQHATPLQ